MRLVDMASLVYLSFFFLLMARFSHSQLQIYKQCPLRYRFQYVDKMPVQFDKTVYTLLGTAVHSALEYLYKQIGWYVTPSLEDIVKVMKDARNAEKETLIQPATPDEEEQFLTRGEWYLRWYYATYAPFTQARPWWFEQRIAYKIDDDTNLSGIIDRLDSKDDTIYITDYKTNQRLYPDDQDIHEEQLVLYGLAIQQTYGKKFTNIVGRVIYLHLEKEVEREITKERMQTIKEEIMLTIAEIRRKAADYNGWLGNTDAFAYVTGDHCKYCAFEIVCPAWKHKYAQDEVVPTELGERTLKHMIDEYGALQAKIRELEKEEKSLASILLTFAQSREESRFFGNEYMLSTRKYERAVVEDQLGFLQMLMADNLIEQYAKPNDTILLQEYKKGTLQTKIRDFVKIDSKKTLGGTRPRTKTGDEEDD